MSAEVALAEDFRGRRVGVLAVFVLAVAAFVFLRATRGLRVTGFFVCFVTALAVGAAAVEGSDATGADTGAVVGWAGSFFTLAALALPLAGFAVDLRGFLAFTVVTASGLVVASSAAGVALAADARVVFCRARGLRAVVEAF